MDRTSKGCPYLHGNIWVSDLGQTPPGLSAATRLRTSRRGGHLALPWSFQAEYGLWTVSPPLSNPSEKVRAWVKMTGASCKRLQNRRVRVVTACLDANT